MIVNGACNDIGLDLATDAIYDSMLEAAKLAGNGFGLGAAASAKITAPIVDFALEPVKQPR